MPDLIMELERRSVSSRYGAPMGRIEYVHEPAARVHLQKVRFEDGDYDAGGAYWGGDSPLYCAMDEADAVCVFVRAPDWNAARAVLRRVYPELVVIEDVVAVPQDAQWWSDGSGRIELRIGLQDARGCSHSGQCWSDIVALAQEPYVQTQLGRLSATAVRTAVRDYFADDRESLYDHQSNLRRLLWLACCDLAEQATEEAP